MRLNKGERVRSEAKDLYANLIERCATVIREQGISKIVNFGCSYAYVDSELAKRFPDVEFYALDRSELSQGV